MEQLKTLGEIELDGLTFTQEEIHVYRQAKAATQTASNRFVSISIDPELTETLVAEGAMREIVSHIQKLRKQKGYKVTERIQVSVEANETLTLYDEVDGYLGILFNHYREADATLRQFTDLVCRVAPASFTHLEEYQEAPEGDFVLQG